MDTHHKEIGQEIIDKKVLTDEIKTNLNNAIEEFKKVFLAEG